jgi:PAS domain S-box-containing protein
MTSDAAARELAEAAAENEKLLEFLYSCPVGLIEMSRAGDVRLMNPIAAQLLLPVAEPSALANLFSALEPYAPDLRFIADSFTGQRGTFCENLRVHLRQAPGTGPQVLACSLVKVEEDRYMAVLNDITEQVSQERRLREAESWFSMILAGVNDFALLSLDSMGRISAWNASGERQTGYSSRDVVGRTMNVFYFPDEAVQGRALQQVDLARRDGWHIDEGWRRRKDGSRYWCQSLVSALEEKTGEVAGFSVVLRDVTERKSDSDEIRRLLTTDQLTGVCNRARFFELGEAELARWKRFRQPLSALMIDIDHFKRINDTDGHAAGTRCSGRSPSRCRRRFAPSMPSVGWAARNSHSVALHRHRRSGDGGGPASAHGRGPVARLRRPAHSRHGEHRLRRAFGRDAGPRQPAEIRRCGTLCGEGRRKEPRRGAARSRGLTTSRERRFPTRVPGG